MHINNALGLQKNIRLQPHDELHFNLRLGFLTFKRGVEEIEMDHFSPILVREDGNPLPINSAQSIVFAHLISEVAGLSFIPADTNKKDEDLAIFILHPKKIEDAR